MAKRFSLKNKLILIFGALIAASSLIEGALAVRIARKAVTEKISAHLTGKADDVAEIIDGKINQWYQFLEGIARMPALQSENATNLQKTQALDKEATYDASIIAMNFADSKGNLYLSGGSVHDINNLAWFKDAQGKNFTSEPFLSRIYKQFVIAFTVPVYNSANAIIGSLITMVPGDTLCHEIEDIVVGETGQCYILGLTGVTIADKDTSLVTEQKNTMNDAKTDSSLKVLADFERTAMTSPVSSIRFWKYEGIDYISSFAKMKSTNWTVIIQAPVGEFMGSVTRLSHSMLFMGIFILIAAVVVVYVVARKIVRPIGTTVAALQNIAQGEGDLTVRLPVTGNDEVTELAEFFNQTIAKIGNSIRAVGASSKVMEGLGEELSSDMTETASAINEISSNIDGVKQQAMTQAASVTETSSTVEEII
ncbi:MAG: cache domain-containing protein, partial [Treponema sp.]